MTKNFINYLKSEAVYSKLPLGFPKWTYIIFGFIYGFGKHIPLDDPGSASVAIFSGFFWGAGVTLWLFIYYRIKQRKA